MCNMVVFCSKTLGLDLPHWVWLSLGTVRVPSHGGSALQFMVSPSVDFIVLLLHRTQVVVGALSEFRLIIM